MQPQTNWKSTNFPEMEKANINYWNSNNIGQKLIDQTKSYPAKVFLDGPPFATGKMHYGHVLVSTIKDTMARYFNMNGFYVDRRTGWDTHGLPIEAKVKEQIGYKTKDELFAFGIDNHNKICRELIESCTDQWYHDFERIGRWTDANHMYKTMDVGFMESVIWAFNELYKKGMIYEGYKVMPYSTGCNTPLSHFEAKQNYKDVIDISVICMFEIISTQYSKFDCRTDHKSYILAWTTTPWTLPSNMALCTFTNGCIMYLFDRKLQCYVLLSENKYELTYSKLKYENVSRFNIIEKLDSGSLVNVQYKPPFDYFWKIQNESIELQSFRVLCDSNIKVSGDDAGTGFVHLAPAFGEEDFRICCENGVIDNKNTRENLINPIDDDGCFTEDVPNYHKCYVKAVEKDIIKVLTTSGLLFESKPYKHSYPFCYRTDTPLLYRITSAWFLAASDASFRKAMIQNNAKINWMPANVGKNHFDNWLQGSVDWCVSRARYWGTPIPIWQSQDKLETICIGSIAELERLSGVTGINDLHIDIVDKITIKSKTGKILHRVKGVLDCWFESGSMPFAQLHWPFENKELFDPSRQYLADFITESKDQTRGWFYTLTVLATALFDKPAFNNVIVTGILNGDDGQKMSKSKGNYPDPNILLDKFGSDSLRLYLFSTPVVKAECIKFDKAALHSMCTMQSNSISKIYNMVLFLIEKINLYHRQYPTDSIMYPSMTELNSFTNILDRWIIDKTGLVTKAVKEDMDQYKIAMVVPKLLEFIEQVTNWYVKMARERMKGIMSRYNNADSRLDWRQSIQTLLFVLIQLTKILAPIIPFICETIYGMLKIYLGNPNKSIHLESYPTSDQFIFDSTLGPKFNVIQKLITLIREVRDTTKLNSRRPIAAVQIGCLVPTDWDIIQDILCYVKSESNVMTLQHIDIKPEVNCGVCIVMSELSVYLRSIGKIDKIKQIKQFVENMTLDQIEEFRDTKIIIEPISQIQLNDTMIKLNYTIVNPSPNVKYSDGIMIKVDTTYNDIVRTEHWMRLITTAVQMHRKQVELKPWDVVTIKYAGDEIITDFIKEHLTALLCINTVNWICCNSIDLDVNYTSHDIADFKLNISSTTI